MNRLSRLELAGRIFTSLAFSVLVGCMGFLHEKNRPVEHVPLVHYRATFNDKDCRRHPDGVRWICNNVVLDPDEIQAHPN